MSIHVDRRIRSFHNAERPKQECKIDMQRLVRNVLSWAYSIGDVGSGIKDDGYNLPSAKTIRIGGHVVPDPAVVVKPSLRVKYLRVWKGDRVLRYSPR